MILEIATLALGLIGQFTTLAKNPNIKPAIKGLYDYVNNLFTKKLAKEDLKKVKENNFDDASISKLKILLSDRLEDEADLVKQLEKKIHEVKRGIKQEGLEKQVSENFIKITGDKNIVIFDIKTSGNININNQ